MKALLALLLISKIKMIINKITILNTNILSSFLIVFSFLGTNDIKVASVSLILGLIMWLFSLVSHTEEKDVETIVRETLDKIIEEEQNKIQENNTPNGRKIG